MRRPRRLARLATGAVLVLARVELDGSASVVTAPLTFGGG